MVASFTSPKSKLEVSQFHASRAVRHLPLAQFSANGHFHFGGEAALRSVAFAFGEEPLNAVTAEAIDPRLDGGLAVLELIGDLLGGRAFYGEFDGEHAFALPAWSFVFETGEKLGSNA